MKESMIFGKISDAMNFCYINKITPSDIIALYGGVEYELAHEFEAFLFEDGEPKKDVEKVIIIWEEG